MFRNWFNSRLLEFENDWNVTLTGGIRAGIIGMSISRYSFTLLLMAVAVDSDEPAAADEVVAGPASLSELVDSLEVGETGVLREGVELPIASYIFFKVEASRRSPPKK